MPASVATTFSSTSLLWEAELDGHHPLTRRVLEILEHALVSGVVGHHETEPRSGLERDSQPLDWQLSPMVGKWMKHDRRVLSGLDDLVEIAQRAFPYRSRERSVDPFRLASAKQEAPDQVGGRQVVVAGDGDQWPADVVSHCFNESRLPAAGRPLQQNGKPLPIGGFEDLLLVTDSDVVRPAFRSPMSLRPLMVSFSVTGEDPLHCREHRRQPAGSRWRLGRVISVLTK